MRTNTKNVSPPVHTREGGPGAKITPEQTLRRMSLTAMLFEKQFYQSGTQHAKLVADTIDKLVEQKGYDEAARIVTDLAAECRTMMYLRHMPLFLLSVLTRYKGAGARVALGLERCIQRPDELGEFIAIYGAMYPEAIRNTIDWRTGKPNGVKRGVKLASGVKRGLAKVFAKFSAYQLAKYNRDAAYSLTDVMRLVRPKPTNVAQAVTWHDLVKGKLESPDTWEVALSAGGDKKEVFERLLTENKMGGLAFLRNLRNMDQAGVDRALIRSRFTGNFDKVLPYRFIAAAKHAPTWVAELDAAMMHSTAVLPKLPGHTALIVDVSGSMKDPMATYSQMNRMDAACALSVIIRELSESAQVFTFSNNVAMVPSYRGVALGKAIVDSQPHQSTNLGGAMNAIGAEVRAGRVQPFDRVVVITDEQTSDRIGATGGLGYMINVGAFSVGVGYADKGWIHIDGFSDRIVDFMYNHEKVDNATVEEEE